MYTNYGDVNFFEHGILIDSDHTDTVFDMLICEPYTDKEDLYQFSRIQVDIEEDWIDKEAVMAYAGMTKDNFDPIRYAIACEEYYGLQEFGADSFSYNYNWQKVNKEEILKQLKGYLIDYSGMKDPFGEPEASIIAVVQKYRDNDFSLDLVDLPKAVEDQVYELVSPYCGCSTRGNASGIISEFASTLKSGRNYPLIPDSPCIVITHNFDPETTVYAYETEEEAKEALARLYSLYYQEEIDNNSDLDESNCFCDAENEGYAVITWEGEKEVKDKTEFTLSSIMREV